ncbi:hypothetical protein [Phreatobacter sp.]|uniref:hypothetical protein n=1 Tax=Phreatobacter sp. TaxID=1966341 RepID=UPI003F7030A1
MTRMKTLALATVAALSLAVVAAPKAEAAPFPWRGFVAGAVIGTTLGAVAAHGAYARGHYGYGYGDCFMTRRWIDTPYGPALRRVRVCH